MLQDTVALALLDRDQAAHTLASAEADSKWTPANSQLSPSSLAGWLRLTLPHPGLLAKTQASAWRLAAEKRSSETSWGRRSAHGGAYKNGGGAGAQTCTPSNEVGASKPMSP
eukprot:1156191-Pelagomonas_calceolata.AAC.12